MVQDFAATICRGIYRGEQISPVRRLINVITKLNHKQSSSPGLAKGQVWKLKHAYIHIVDLGHRLLHYRMLDTPGQRGVRTQMSGIDVMWAYLKSRHARLIKTGAGA